MALPFKDSSTHDRANYKDGRKPDVMQCSCDAGDGTDGRMTGSKRGLGIGLEITVLRQGHQIGGYCVQSK